MRKKQGYLFIVVILFFLLLFKLLSNRIRANKNTVDACIANLEKRTSFTKQVFQHYIRYHCIKEGVCQEQKALAMMEKDWPKLYWLGFEILVDQKEQQEINICTK